MMVVTAEREGSLAPGNPAAAESARYALLRRLAPSMRHHLVVNLQPIGMIYEVMDRRLKAAQPDLASVHESAHKINGFARAALHSCLDIVSWLAPEEGATTSVAAGVRECSSLLATSLSFRGFPLRSDIAPIEGQVRRAALRNLLTACLLHATDHLDPPAELVLSAEPQARGVRIELTVLPGTGEGGISTELAYRALEWDDVLALAAAEGVEVERAGAGVRLMLAWA